MGKNKRKQRTKEKDPHYLAKKNIILLANEEKKLEALKEKGKEQYAPKIGRQIKKAEAKINRIKTLRGNHA